MKIVFFQRKPRKYGTFSVEAIFNDLRKRLPSGIQSEVRISRFESNGLFRRLFCALEAAFHQGDVNHVTGDVHFLTIFLRRRKTLLTVLDCGAMLNPSALKRWFYKIFFLQIPIWRSRYVTAISEATKKEILRYVNCPPEKIAVIPVAIARGYQPFPQPFRKENPVLLHVGLAPNKNLNRLIEALEGLPVHLSIVGRLEEHHLEKLNRHRIDYEAVFNISDEEMIEKYRHCDMLAFVSTYEGFGMPIVEANSIGRPVLTSCVSSMPEVAGDAACLVNPFDVQSIREGLLKIINDEDYRNRLIDNGFKNSRRFSPEKITADYYHLYLKMAGKDHQAKAQTHPNQATTCAE